MLVAAMLVGVAIATSARASGPDEGFLGRPLAEVLQSGFFSWFHLVETGSAAAAGGGLVISYKPDGARFHRMTTLEVTVDTAGIVGRMELWLLRSFIDSPVDAPFARDIAKSFLNDAPAADDAAALAPLAAEVEYRLSSSETVIVGPGYRKPELPSEPSPGYRTYSGARASHLQELGHSKLEMSNEHGPDGDALRLALIAK
ncbi:MAG: hypothetical protein ACLQME_13530 [Alphaproteobacteria bacterium]